MSKEFKAVLLRAGENRDGVVLDETVVKNCAGTDIAVLDANNNPVPGATATAVWDEDLKVLVGVGQMPDDQDLTGTKMELLVLAKAIQGVKDLATGVGREIIEKHSDAVQDIDRTAQIEVIEIWYDLRNWYRFVKTSEPEEREQATVGESAAGPGRRFAYGGMSCVEEGVASFITEAAFESGKRAAQASRAYAKVRRPLHKDSLYAENALIGLMQKIYDEDPYLKGQKVVLPIKFLDEFEEVSQ